ncbi:MAG: MFS transporter [Thermostichus sp. DG_1_5_bins_95]
MSLPLALAVIFPCRRSLEELDPPLELQRLWMFCLCGGMFAFFAQTTAFFPILPVYLTQRWGSEAPVGLVVGAMAAGVLMWRPLIGVALDWWGRKPLLCLGLVVAVLIQPLYLLAPSPQWLIPVRILHGLAQAGVATASQTFLADLVVPEKRTAMMGYLAMANTLGFAFGPWLGTRLYQAGGFQAFILGLLWLLILGILLSVPLPWLPPPQPEHLSHGRIQSYSGAWSTLLCFPIREATFLFLISSLLHGGLTTYLPLLVAETGDFYSLFALGAVVVRWGLGQWGQRVSYRILSTAAFWCSGMALIGIVWQPAWLSGWAILYSFGFGTLFPVLSTIVSLAVPPQQRGRVYSLFLMGFDSGMTLGSAGMGSLLGLVPLSSLFLSWAGLGLGAGWLAFRQFARPLVPAEESSTAAVAAKSS